MKYIKVVIASFMVMSSLAHADESALDKAKVGALQLWEKAKVTTSEVAEKTSQRASEVGDKATKIGSKVSASAKETGAIAWEKTKEVGSVTAETARKGADKIRGLVDKEECQKDSALCMKE